MDAYLPHASVLLDAMMLTPERLRAGTKAAVSLPTLRALLTVAVSALPFDQEFYLSAYADVAAAHRSGQIRDPHTHFIETGYLEGRLGARPAVDDAFYRRCYPDVAAALATGEVKSCYEHYLQSGAAEGRSPNEAQQAQLQRWLDIFNRK